MVDFLAKWLLRKENDRKTSQVKMLLPLEDSYEWHGHFKFVEGSLSQLLSTLYLFVFIHRSGNYPTLPRLTYSPSCSFTRSFSLLTSLNTPPGISCPTSPDLKICLPPEMKKEVSVSSSDKSSQTAEFGEPGARGSHPLSSGQPAPSASSSACWIESGATDCF